MTERRRRDRDAVARVVFAPPAAWAGNEVRIAGDEAHHLVRVLRARRGDRVEAVDGDGARALVEVAEIGRDRARCTIVARVPTEPAPSLAVRLAPALIRPQRMDWIVEKAAELGASSIAPLTTSRSVIDAKEGRVTRHAARWDRLAIAAMKQSRRSTRARIEPASSLAEFLRGRDPSVRLIVPWEGERVRRLDDSLRERALHRGERIDLVIGPEGGFAPDETESIRAAGGDLVSLGTSVLRSETAALATLAVLIHMGGSA